MTRESKKCIVCDTEFFRQKNYTDYSWNTKKCCDEGCGVELTHMRRMVRKGIVEQLVKLCQNSGLE